ncbi:MAG TPA: hypothetical protein ENJ95_17840 [Bacteroidetes bacterium]|nr:hypothetical protein [Bacteroidota bacterium]
MWKNLKKEMEVSPNAVIEFKKAERNRNLFLLSGLATSGLAIWFWNIDRQDKKKSNAVLYPLLGADVFTVYFGINTIKKTKKAVRIRNRDIKK